MSQADFSRKSGWSTRMISYYCNDERKMSVEALYVASVILNVPMDQFYEWDVGK
ncbi:helix-turn-helix transcriptional regulator [Paenibacillus illinoisensis]|uniref:Helix-turn-helix transcriptional regulator n=1 Tax=Paenibacillus illinoisensis TaxID=59845 RepID=A0ABW8HYG8_9BACL